MKTFRFGVNVGPSRSRAEWVEKARKLEDLGYATLTVPDHLTDFFAPIPALISAAEATKNLRVRTNVLNNDFRHPVLVARELRRSICRPRAAPARLRRRIRAV
jgi:alkanesulfonate monooxygenase SsuD/methylene tetrahydromethanopterin reductase-like flavin-dependent oxidoreductase (luciferase family)